MAVIHSYSAIPSSGVQHFLDNNSDKNGKKWNSYTLTFAQDTEELNTYAMLGGKRAYPMTVVLDKEGRITFVKAGSCSEKDLREAIENAGNN